MGGFAASVFVAKKWFGGRVSTGGESLKTDAAIANTPR
jgi:hypothetical protein